MEDISLLSKLNKVQAPPVFEQRVMAELSLRKRDRTQSKRALRLSLAGAFASLLVVFVLVNVFVLQKESPVRVSDVEKNVSLPSAKEKSLSPKGVIPIIESVDYSTEIRSRAQEPQTIYILEQVSDVIQTGVKY